MNNELFENIRAQLKKASEATSKQLRQLSGRERALLYGALAFLACFLVYMIYEPISGAFRQQSAQLQDLQQRVNSVHFALARYLKLKSRQLAIEEMYKGVEIEEGVRSLLANLIESKAGIAAGQYDITDNQPREFGTGYQQTSFRVRFTIGDYARMVSFIDEIVNGAKPLILNTLTIKKRQTSDGSLEVEMDVSSIRRIR